MKNLTQYSSTAAQLLRERNATVAVAESSTGGLISASLLAVPGASSYFLGGSIIYTLTSRKVLLGMTRMDVEGLAPLTEAMALAFAEKARVQLGATWGVAELGIAGPTDAPYGAAGTCVVGITGPNTAGKLIQTASADREENMWAFTRGALELLAETVSKRLER